MLEFDSIDFRGIGEKSGVPDRQWGRLFVGFKDNETDHFRSVEIKVLLPAGPDVTMRELEEAARREAKAILAVALDLLEQSSVAELSEREDLQAQAEDDEIAAEADRRWNEQFPDIPRPFA